MTHSEKTHLVRARAIARLLDTEFRLGPLNFGLDGVIGLIPGIGDFISAGANFYLIYVANHFKAPPSLLAFMLLNIGFDFLLGLIPFIGDITDFFYKSAKRNMDILEEFVARREQTLAQQPQKLPSAT